MAVHLHRVAADGVVEAVDVLRDDARDEAAGLESRKCFVRRIWQDARAHERLGPALPDARGIAGEHVDMPVDHGVEPLPETAGRAEVGQPARGRDARARQCKHGPVALEKSRERCRVGIQGHVDTVAAA